MDTRLAEIMYQQWCQGNSGYIHCWLDFVSMVAREFNITEAEAINILQKQRWFEW
jgi:hypothetical protein